MPETPRDSDQATTSAKPAVGRVHPPDWLIRLVGPLVRRLVRRGRGRLTDRVAVLEFTGRRTAAYAVPVGYRPVEGRGAVVTSSRWPPQLRRRRRRHPRATRAAPARARPS